MKTIKKYIFITILILTLVPINVYAGWKFVSPMPNGRYGHAATLGPDGKIYVMGGMVFKTTEKGMKGRYYDGMYSSLVYDRIEDNWEVLEPVPGYIDEGNYKIYEKENDYWRTVRPVKDKEDYYELYFPGKDYENSWKMYPDPIPPEKLRKTGVEREGDGVAIVTGKDGLIYWLGGDDKEGGIGEDIVLPYDPIKKLWPDSEHKRIYDFVTLTSAAWTSKTVYKTNIPSMNERRIDHKAVVTSDGKIYVMGGRRRKIELDKMERLSTIGEREVTSSVECYDPTTNKWEYKKSMSVKRFLFAAVVGTDNRIYTFGGTDFIDQYTRKIYNMTEVYDPKTDTWTTLKPMPEPRDGAAGVLGADGKIYIIGGASEYKGSPLKSVLIYDPVNDTWEKGPSMNVPRDTLAAVATPDGKIYAIGGTDLGAYETKQKINLFLPSKFELYTGKVQDTVEVLNIFE